VQANGLGYMLDFGCLDSLIGIPDQHAYADVFNRGAGSVMHMGAGALAVLLPSQWFVLSGSAFLAFESARLAAGKPMWEFAGAIVEFSIGVLIGILLGGMRA
jgi:hypothetical protein